MTQISNNIMIMKKIIIAAILLFCISCETKDVHVNSSDKIGSDSIQQENETEYDSLLAKKLGADQYGMHRYVIAFLKAGPNRDQDSVTAANIQKGHMENIHRMANEGKLVLAGPFLDDSEFRGIYVFNVETVEEAKALTETDPAIKSGRLEMELHPWYGSAALMDVNRVHGIIAKPMDQ